MVLPITLRNSDHMGPIAMLVEQRQPLVLFCPLSQRGQGGFEAGWGTSHALPGPRCRGDISALPWLSMRGTAFTWRGGVCAAILANVLRLVPFHQICNGFQILEP